MKSQVCLCMCVYVSQDRWGNECSLSWRWGQALLNTFTPNHTYTYRYTQMHKIPYFSMSVFSCVFSFYTKLQNSVSPLAAFIKYWNIYFHNMYKIHVHTHEYVCGKQWKTRINICVEFWATRKTIMLVQICKLTNIHKCKSQTCSKVV